MAGGKRGWVLGGVAVLLAATAGLLAGKAIYGGRIAGLPVSASVTQSTEPPTVPAEVSKETAGATVTYVDGPGRMLLDMTGTLPDVRAKVAEARPEACRALTGELSKRYPFDTVTDKIRPLPDPFLGEWLVTYYGVAFGALDACANQGDTAPYLKDADLALDLVNRRLSQLRAAR